MAMWHHHALRKVARVFAVLSFAWLGLERYLTVEDARRLDWSWNLWTTIALGVFVATLIYLFWDQRSSYKKQLEEKDEEINRVAGELEAYKDAGMTIMLHSINAGFGVPEDETRPMKMGLALSAVLENTGPKLLRFHLESFFANLGGTIISDGTPSLPALIHPGKTRTHCFLPIPDVDFSTLVQGNLVFQIVYWVEPDGPKRRMRWIHDMKFVPDPNQPGGVHGRFYAIDEAPQTKVEPLVFGIVRNE